MPYDAALRDEINEALRERGDDRPRGQRPTDYFAETEAELQPLIDRLIGVGWTFRRFMDDGRQHYHLKKRAPRTITRDDGSTYVRDSGQQVTSSALIGDPDYGDVSDLEALLWCLERAVETEASGRWD